MATSEPVASPPDEPVPNGEPVGDVSTTPGDGDAASRPGLQAKLPDEAPEGGDWGDEEQEPNFSALDFGLDPADEASKVEVQTADPTEPYKSATTFEEIGLSPELLKGIYAMKFQKPSKIQAASLPLIFPAADGTRRNLIAQGHNGSGKTACFVLGMLSNVDPARRVTQALCIVPTRELARQIVEVVREIGKFTKAEVRLFVKETDEERRASRAARAAGASDPIPHIAVGTPGKIMDLIRRRQLKLGDCQVCVLDEADEMVNTQGMGDQTLRIKQFLPPHTQILLFSATYGDDVRELAKRMAPGANVIWVRRETLSLDKVKQYYFKVSSAGARYDTIQEIYESLTLGQTIIFVRTRAAAQQLTDSLRRDGNAVSVLYGGQMLPEERDRVIDEFRQGVTKVLVTTNVLSRGVDVRSVTAVLNYDLPTDVAFEADPETYLHRIGRTGRFGSNGIAINFVYDEKSMRILKDLENYYQKEIVQVEDVEQLEQFIKSV